MTLKDDLESIQELVQKAAPFLDSVDEYELVLINIHFNFAPLCLFYLHGISICELIELLEELRVNYDRKRDIFKNKYQIPLRYKR